MALSTILNKPMALTTQWVRLVGSFDHTPDQNDLFTCRVDTIEQKNKELLSAPEQTFSLEEANQMLAQLTEGFNRAPILPEHEYSLGDKAMEALSALIHTRQYSFTEHDCCCLIYEELDTLDEHDCIISTGRYMGIVSLVDTSKTQRYAVIKVESNGTSDLSICDSAEDARETLKDAVRSELHHEEDDPTSFTEFASCYGVILNNGVLDSQGYLRLCDDNDAQMEYVLNTLTQKELIDWFHALTSEQAVMIVKEF